MKGWQVLSELEKAKTYLKEYYKDTAFAYAKYIDPTFSEIEYILFHNVCISSRQYKSIMGMINTFIQHPDKDIRSKYPDIIGWYEIGKLYYQQQMKSEDNSDFENMSKIPEALEFFNKWLPLHLILSMHLKSKVALR